MRRGSFLVNTSRGAVVDELALLESLERGHLAGAALDVLSNEPPAPDEIHPLRGYARRNNNLLITPHIAGASQDAIEKTDVYVIERFREWLAGRCLP
jgi:phosphoglycerate dehydrogenase-like enzyme